MVLKFDLIFRNFLGWIFGFRFIFAFLSIISFLIYYDFYFSSDRNVEIDNNEINNQTGKQKIETQTTLFNTVKILCLINASKKQIRNRAIHINATWAQRCNKYYFLTFDQNTYLPYLYLKVPETRNELWNKWKAAFKWVYQNEIENFDYFLRADDDSYFAIENLRNFLLPFNKTEDLYFGARFKFENVSKGYMSGGAGVILTKSAIKKVVENFENSSICPQETDENDDLSLGICAQNLNFTFVDTRDSLGRHRMLPWSPTTHFIKGLDEDQLKYLYYPYNQSPGFECCAKDMISFHYVFGKMLYMMEFLIYHSKTTNNFNENINGSTIDKNASDEVKLIKPQ